MENNNNNDNNSEGDPPYTIVVREVYNHNVEFEFTLIRNIIDKFPFVSMDTEFPGVVFWHTDDDIGGGGGGGATYSRRISPAIHYSLLKQNVDALKIIQLGLTLTDSQGNLPDLGHSNSKYRYIWQFNFKDFDISRDLHASDSIELLCQNGIDFDRNRDSGVDSVKFGELMMSSGLVCNEDHVTWVTFHCAYDFGYLIKVLTQKPLPSQLGEFLNLVRVFFGVQVYDVKYMIKFCNGLYGGLDRVARALELNREVGRSHQSGSDSLLTWRVFLKIRDAYFSKNASGVEEFSNLLYGLELS